jgi:hypothetical protein
MDWIPIDFSNPLILLRVYLAAIWVVAAIYGSWVIRSIPRKSPYWPLAVYSIFAAATGAASYFLGAATTFSSYHGFLWVAGLLTFTPVALVLWLFVAKTIEKRKP